MLNKVVSSPFSTSSSSIFGYFLFCFRFHWMNSYFDFFLRCTSVSLSLFLCLPVFPFYTATSFFFFRHLGETDRPGRRLFRWILSEKIRNARDFCELFLMKNESKKSRERNKTTKISSSNLFYFVSFQSATKKKQSELFSNRMVWVGIWVWVE